MKSPLNFSAILGFCFCCAAFPGCGDGRPADMPKLHPVSLTFTLDDTSLADAFVTLYSTDEQSRWAVSGRTDAAGCVSLRTNGRYPGAPAGRYKIVVDKVERRGPPVPKESELPKDETERQKVFDEIGKQTTIIRIVDEKFLSPQTTPLEYEVVAGDNEEIFDLGKAVSVTLLDH